jgi:K+-transporting ATPase ATPase C chain
MSTIRPTVVLFVLLTAVTGVIYPALVTGVAQVCFPHAANGSVVKREGTAAGSELIGQPFAAPDYFWGRPSATVPHGYNAAASSGSNLGPTNPALLESVKQRLKALHADPSPGGPPPVDLVTASGSGLDPHISPAAAEYQMHRVAIARGAAVEEVRKLVAAYTEPRWLGVLGEPRVNVVLLNLALDEQFGRLLAATKPGNAE